MDRLKSPQARLLLGIGCLLAGFIVMISSWSNIRDETSVAVQLPYLLPGGIGALMLTVLAAVFLRSTSDGPVRDRLGDVEITNQDLRDRVDYLTQLLEAALLPDDTARPAGSSRTGAGTHAAPAYAAASNASATVR